MTPMNIVCFYEELPPDFYTFTHILCVSHTASPG
jgi:hypothetical protein